MCLGQEDSEGVLTTVISIVDSSLDAEQSLLSHVTDPLDESSGCRRTRVRQVRGRLQARFPLGSMTEPLFVPGGEQVGLGSTRTPVRRVRGGPSVSDGGDLFVILQHSGTCQHTHTHTHD